MDNERKLWDLLATIHQLVQWTADQEATSAWVNGVAAQGALMDGKMRLLYEAERILKELSTPDAKWPPRTKTP